MSATLIPVISLTLLCCYLLYRTCRLRSIASAIRHVTDLLLRNVDAYVMLVDAELNVAETNYYMLTDTPRPAVPPKIGNLLRCKNGEDAGLCGTHELCKTCPVRAALVHALESGTSFRGMEVSMVRYTPGSTPSTAICEVSITGNYLTVGKGSPHLLVTLYDITDQKRIREQLTEARIRAEEADRMKTQFLANTSHELRTPLNAIVGFSELLATNPSPEEKREYVRIIRTNNDMLLQLVNDILDLSKIEAGTLEYQYAEVELNTVMEEMEGIFRMRLPAENSTCITFRKVYPSCYLYTDRKRLAQVVSNFLSNAVKFTPSGSIDFGFEIRETEIYIYVTDTGTGVSKERQQLLFRRFVKVGSHKQGVGIGLAISKSIVESMGGKIGVVSGEGKGSTFWFTLPRRSEA